MARQYLLAVQGCLSKPLTFLIVLFSVMLQMSSGLMNFSPPMFKPNTLKKSRVTASTLHVGPPANCFLDMGLCWVAKVLT